jgi:flagellar motility protein MotE (MotC chaperone)
MAQVPMPRLLPTTMACMAVLLALKCGQLVQAVAFQGSRLDPLSVAAARAADHEATKRAGPPVAGGPPPTMPAPPKPQSAQAAPPLATPAPSPTPDSGTLAISDSEKALLQTLRTRRQELDDRAEALKTREAVLGAAEQKVSARVTELQTLQRKLEALDVAQKQKEESGWQGLVKLYEAMKPKDAATIFNDLSMPVLLQVLNRMKDAKAAAVMAAMNPDKARDVTAELARLRLGHDPTTLPDGVAPPTTGG